MAQYMQRGAVPQTDPSANPQTWDWQPVKVREDLRRNALPRQCNDVCFAISLLLVICAMIGFAIYGGINVDWASTRRKDGKSSFNGEDIWKIVLVLLLASAFGIIFAFIWSCILKACAGVMVKMSIFTFLGLKVAMIAICIMYGSTYMYVVAGIMGFSLLLHAIWFCCVWKRIPMAEATLTIAIGVLHRYSAVMWISLAFAFVTIAYIFTCAFGTFGLYHITGLVKEGGAYGFGDTGKLDYMLWLLTTFVFLWGTITIGYVVHAICAGVVGTWYFGTSRKRTVTDAVVRALTTSFGSLAFAAFIVAVIKMLELMAGKAKDKAHRDGNAVAMIMLCILECLLKILGDMMNYLNGLAIIRVAVYGESFCTAAKRTMNMMKYRGMSQLINDDLSNMPVWLGCFIIYMACVPFLFGCYYVMGTTLLFVGKTENQTADMWMYSFFFSLCALFIPISILSTISSFVQSLYVLWGDDPAAMDQVHPQEAATLKQVAYQYMGYRVVYDDQRILGRGGRYA